MTRPLSVLIISLFAIACTPKSNEQPMADSITPAEELSNQLGTATLWFQSAAEMRLSYYQAYNYATMLLDHKLETVKDKRKPAVVLDIDETVLDNSPYQGKLLLDGENYASSSWMEWTALAKAQALPGVKKFVDYAMERGVEVFYISNRKVNRLGATIENLRKEGLPNADSSHVYLKKETSDKTARRAKVSEGYNILVFVGDNLTDYSELYADRGADMGKGLVDENLDELLGSFVMLPNPMYGEWEKAIYNNDYRRTDSIKLEMRKGAIKSY